MCSIHSNLGQLDNECLQFLQARTRSRHIPLGLRDNSRLGRSLIDMVRLGSIPSDQI